MTFAVPTIDDLKGFIVTAVATQAGLPTEQVASDGLFTTYGLDSMAAMAVAVDIEDGFGLTDLPVNLLWDYPTVDTLVPALWDLLQARKLATMEEQ